MKKWLDQYKSKGEVNFTATPTRAVSDNTRTQKFIPISEQEMFNNLVGQPKQYIFVSTDPNVNAPGRKAISKEYENKHKKIKALKSALKFADVATDLMQVGNFIPLPQAQVVGRFGNVIGGGIDAFQSGMDVAEGNYGSAALNFGSSLLPHYIQNQGYRRDMFNTTSGSYADKIASFGNRGGDYIHLTPYVKHANNPVIMRGVNFNRGLLGSLGAETAIDLNQYKSGGSANSLNRTVTCSNCGWSWKLSDGGKDPMTCHKCGGDIKMQQGGEIFTSNYESLGLPGGPNNLKKFTQTAIISSRGQWDYPGQTTIIPSNEITMQGVPYPVMGVSNTGDVQYMQPGEDYTYDGDYVTEYPMMSRGGQHGGLDRWFAEKWVDIKTGKPCGRQEGESRKGYPACRPSKRISSDTPKTSSELSSSERERFKREKTSSQRISYQHQRKEDGGELELAQMGTTTKSKIPKDLSSIGNLYNYFPYDLMENEYLKKQNEFNVQYLKNNSLNSLNNNKINLSVGRFQGAEVPVQLIDELVKSAKKQNIDPWLMVSLMGRESTFGSGTSANEARKRNKTALVSGWNVAEDYIPYLPLRFLADKKVPGVSVNKGVHGWTYNIVDDNELNKYLFQHPELIKQYQEKVAKTPQIGNLNSFDLAAKFLKEKGIQAYNPKSPKYPSLFNEDMRLLKSDIQLKNYMKKLGYNYGGEHFQMKSGGNVPTNPSLWSRAKSLARQKYDVYPSAYANGWAAKWYKSHGGGWRKAEYGMEVMGDGGVPNNPGFNALPEYVQQNIINNMAAGGQKMPPQLAYARFAAAGNLDQLQDYGYKQGGIVLNAGGEKHRIYVKTTNRGEGAKGHIMVNHPTMDKGMWDTIDLTEKAGATTIAQGVAATKKWHRENLYKKQDGGEQYTYWRTGKPMVNDPSMDAISKVLLQRNLDKNFMQRAAGFGYQGGITTRYIPDQDPNSNAVSTLLMSFGDNQVFPTIIQTGPEQLSYQPKQTQEYLEAPSLDVADYFATKGYKRAANDMYGMEYQGGGQIPTVQGDFKKQNKYGYWVTDEAALAKEAQRLNSKKVLTEGGSLIIFDDNWNIVGVDDNPGEPYSNSPSDQDVFYKPMPQQYISEYDVNQYAEGGGIPERYRNMGFTKVGAKRQSTRPGKKWMVLAKKGDQYKVVHGGWKGMQDFKQHHSEQRRENFWSRMGGKNSSKATDPFSPLYWHKRFGTWEEGGQIMKAQVGKETGKIVQSPSVEIPHISGRMLSFIPYSSIYNDYYDKSKKYLSREPFVGTQLKPEDIANAAFKFYAKTNYSYPIELLLSQGQHETLLGKKLKSKHNYFNVGNTDSGETRDFSSPEESVSNYLNLMYNDYLQSGKKNYEDLLKSNNFVNYAGKRYAKNPLYESQILEQSKFINKYLNKKKIGGQSTLNPIVKKDNRNWLEYLKD